MSLYQYFKFIRNDQFKEYFKRRLKTLDYVILTQFVIIFITALGLMLFAINEQNVIIALSMLVYLSLVSSLCALLNDQQERHMFFKIIDILLMIVTLTMIPYLIVHIYTFITKKDILSNMKEGA